MLIIKGLFGGFCQIAFFAVLLLVPAGTWHWPRALQFLTAYGLVMAGSIIALALFAPASLETRLQRPAAKSQPLADKIVTRLMILSIMGWLVFIAVDVFRLHLIPKPSLWVSILGTVLFFAGYAICMVAIYQNAFAAPIVKDQSGRGQVLADTGLYEIIRHPLYLGMVPYLAGLSLWLESYAGLFLTPIVFAFLIMRIFIEEKTLLKTLPGYRDYTTRIKYRLIPFVW
ncbi:MAG: isoprenylcysteine carboxylmethyltransferase family protein [Desulfobacterales bacterium]|nr:isoprenylcysteine carboxylmethyltransferase family protein [Desulfobacterales bacterium]